MKTKKDFILREMDDMNIVVAVGDTSKVFNGVITLNSTAAFMWKVLEKGTDTDSLAKAVADEYDIAFDKAKKDAEKFVEKLRQEDILDD